MSNNVRHAGTRKFNAAEFVGEYVAIAGIEKKNISTSYGPADAYKADVAILSGDEEGLFFEGTLVFGKALVSQLDRAARDHNNEENALIGELLAVTTEDGERTYWEVEETDSAKVLAKASKYGI